MVGQLVGTFGAEITICLATGARCGALLLLVTINGFTCARLAALEPAPRSGG
jgi:hypothetical protein